MGTDSEVFTFGDSEAEGNLSFREREGYAHDGRAASGGGEVAEVVQAILKGVPCVHAPHGEAAALRFFWNAE